MKKPRNRRADRRIPARAPLQPKASSASESLASGQSARAEFLPAAWRRGWLPAALLIFAVVFAYWPALHGGFVWDDDAWTTNIPDLLRDVPGLMRMWLKPDALQQYYPLSGTTFWIDHHLWGMWTFPYHLENVLLHAGSAIIFARLLIKLRVPGAWLAAAIFALHPLMVESAAWITERKNVLSLVFYLAALIAYGKWTRFWNENEETVAPGRWRNWLVACGFFVAALLAKATAFSFPAVVLLIAWWKRGRIRWRADVLPLLPFFAVSIGLGLVTSWLEKHHVGASGKDWSLSFPERCLVAGRAFWFYLGKLVWPVQLCFVYPRWQLNAASLVQWCFPIAALGMLAGLWLARNRIGRAPATAVLFFVGTLFPVLGFMDAYFMRYSFVCDHWAYLSSLGPIALTAALLTRSFERVRVPIIFNATAIILLSALFVLTRQQSAAYSSSETLWLETIRLNPGCWMAHHNLGLEYIQHGRVEESVAHEQEAVSLKPDSADVQNNLGLGLFQLGRVDDAIAHFNRALEIKPDNAKARGNLGVAYLQKGEMETALGHFQKAQDVNPNDAQTHYNLGVCLGGLGRTAEAISQYQTALKIDPSNPAIYNNLAWLLATSPQASLRDGTQAVELAQRASQLAGGGNPQILWTLAASYAEAGRFSDAVETIRRAMQLAADQSNPGLVGQLQAQLKLYQAGVPFHTPAKSN